MPNLDFITKVHQKTPRDYLQRVVGANKAECASIAKRFDREYWDGDRATGYGGYHYDGRWAETAQRLVSHYQIKNGDRILDIGCGKGFLLYEITKIIPGALLAGLDVSSYAIENSKPEVKSFLRVGNAVELPFADHEFDLVLSINTLHNLYLYDLVRALREIQRVGKEKKYILMDSYRTETEKMNLLYWQLTCECFYTPKEWEWIFAQAGYTGDYGFIYFE